MIWRTMKIRDHRMVLGALAVLVLATGIWLALWPSPVQPKKLTVAAARSQDSALVYIADSRGYFREEGLQVTLQHHEYGKAALDAMLEGKADLATAAETPIMLAAMQGKPLAVIAGIFSSDRNLGIIARRASGILAPKDLAGKRIAAAPGTRGDYFRYAFLAANGVPLKSVVQVSLRPEQMADALQAGKVDAVAVWHPFLRLCEKRLGDGGILFSSEPIHTYTFNVAASRRIVINERQAVESFLRALKKAESYVRQHPEQSLEIVSGATGFDLATLKELWGGFDFRLSLEQTLLLSMENEARWAMREKLVENRTLPNFLDFIYFDALEAVKPEAVLITH